MHARSSPVVEFAPTCTFPSLVTITTDFTIYATSTNRKKNAWIHGTQLWWNLWNQTAVEMDWLTDKCKRFCEISTWDEKNSENQHVFKTHNKLVTIKWHNKRSTLQIQDSNKDEVLRDIFMPDEQKFNQIDFTIDQQCKRRHRNTNNSHGRFCWDSVVTTRVLWNATDTCQ